MIEWKVERILLFCRICSSFLAIRCDNVFVVAYKGTREGWSVKASSEHNDVNRRVDGSVKVYPRMVATLSLVGRW